jgi:DNA-directed RNA polymerase subunit RPC12/RpoP
MGIWPFKRQKAEKTKQNSGPECPSCRSKNTKIKVNFGNDQPDYVKTWRGSRYLTYHCFNCETDFSIAEPQGGLDIEAQIGNQLIDDEEALKAAEEDLKRDVDEAGDHRFG